MTFLPDPGALPKAADSERFAVGLEGWKTAVAKLDNQRAREAAARLEDDASGRALLAALFGNSPWLTQCAVSDPGFFLKTLAKGPEAALEVALAGLACDGGRDAVMAALRRARRRAALAIALADIAGHWDGPGVTAALSRFADAALGAALDWLIREAAQRGELDLDEGPEPSRRAGLFILGLGKLGAHELNYSSDIDLIALYDAERVRYTGRQSLPQFYVRTVRDLVGMLETRTRDGYVFRTDLRLRPDPGSTPLAVSVEAAETYYESTGQNWERAALIKARVVTGDADAGADFLKALQPFLWRKHLDFAAIEDIHSIKRQIHAERGGGRIAVAGHNVKLGRGGIREIEFFAQTQQLIWGGRVPQLRAPGTCATLAALAEQGRISAEARDELSAAYWFLRRTEHRLQMVNDRQTHTLPEDSRELERFAVFLGFEGAGAFEKELRHHLGRVEHHYAHLFEEAPTLARPGNLVFTGGEDDPQTLETLADMGFADGSAISERIRSWHRGRYRATRSARARELLTELVPALLDALAKTANPAAAFRNFDNFLAGLPAGVQLFSLFLANPGLLELIAEIMGSAPKLASYLASNPSLLDGVLAGDFFGELEDRDSLAKGLSAMLALARDYEDVLDRARRFANDHKFQVGMQVLRAGVGADRAGRALSDLAEVVIDALFTRVTENMAARHGGLGSRGMCVVALGKLGGRELTENSDLDLLFVYDDAGEPVSDGARPLAATQYYARLSQQMITAISAPTAEGKLYEVDMRLRPSGNAGPIASSLEAFARYQAEQAWAWEHMALTRARVIAGDRALADRIEATIDKVLTAPRDHAKLKADVLDMRVRLARGHPASSMWDVKYADGGLIDVEFIAQYLQLAHAAAAAEVLHPNTTEALSALARAGAIAEDTARALGEAGRLWRTLQAVLRFTFEGTFDEEAAPAGLKAVLARAGGAPDFEALKARMADTARFVRETFVASIGDPAES